WRSRSVNRVCCMAYLGSRRKGGKQRRLCNSGGLGADRRLNLDGLDLRPRVRPGNDFKMAVRVLGYRRAAFDPITTVHITDAKVVVNSSMVDVAADHTIRRMTLRFGHKRFFVFADIAHCVLDLQLGPL